MVYYLGPYGWGWWAAVNPSSMSSGTFIVWKQELYVILEEKLKTLLTRNKIPVLIVRNLYKLHPGHVRASLRMFLIYIPKYNQNYIIINSMINDNIVLTFLKETMLWSLCLFYAVETWRNTPGEGCVEQKQF